MRRSPRLVPQPVFILSPIRAGSTLLRVLLNSHSQIRAPHEMHLRTLHVTMAREFSTDVMADLGLDKDELEHLLWDCVLHLQLQRSGKSVIVDKTPANVLMWKRLRRGWPRARYVFLLRDPASIVESVVARRADGDRAAATSEVLDYAAHLDAARAVLNGLTIRYEDLTADPAHTMRSVCAHLRVRWSRACSTTGASTTAPSVRSPVTGARTSAPGSSSRRGSRRPRPTSRRRSGRSPDDGVIRRIEARSGHVPVSGRCGIVALL